MGVVLSLNVAVLCCCCENSQPFRSIPFLYVLTVRSLDALDISLLCVNRVLVFICVPVSGFYRGTNSLINADMFHQSQSLAVKHWPKETMSHSK